MIWVVVGVVVAMAAALWGTLSLRVLREYERGVVTSQIAQTTLRSVLGRADLDTLLAHRGDLNEDLRKIIDDRTGPWGVQVNAGPLVRHHDHRAVGTSSHAHAGGTAEDALEPAHVAAAEYD